MIGLLIQDIFSFIKKCTLSYEYWWLQLFVESPQHILIETGLICFIIWLLLIRRTVDPKRASNNSQLSKKEIDELIETWQPEAVVPALTDEAKAVLNNQLVTHNFYYYYFTCI